jgi:hypothetical protein
LTVSAGTPGEFKKVRTPAKAGVVTSELQNNKRLHQRRIFQSSEKNSIAPPSGTLVRDQKDIGAASLGCNGTNEYTRTHLFAM